MLSGRRGSREYHFLSIVTEQLDNAAFFLTHTSLHVFRRHEPVIAQAPVLSRYVCALATITDIGVIFTLINV